MIVKPGHERSQWTLIATVMRYKQRGSAGMPSVATTSGHENGSQGKHEEPINTPASFQLLLGGFYFVCDRGKRRNARRYSLGVTLC